MGLGASMKFDEDYALGKVTRSTAIRLKKALTWEGLQSYRKNLDFGLSPRQAIHKIITEDRARDKARAAKARADFILYGEPVAKLSVVEFIKAHRNDSENRWKQKHKFEQEKIIANWRATTLTEALNNLEKHQLKMVEQKKDFAFRFQHVKIIQEAIEYGLEYNREAFDYYRKLKLL